MPSPHQTLSRRGRLPDFLIIGGMKCGSTTLYDYLAAHPSVFMSPIKEPSYFSDPLVLEKGLEWYRELFAGAAPGQLCGEASTSYSRIAEYRIGWQPEVWIDYTGTPERIAETLPQVKLIYVLRHPVDRAYSHYSFLMQFEPVMSFDQALKHHRTILESSDYIRQIRRYLDHFPQEQMLFVILDDLQQQPDRELARIQDFLGLERCTLSDTPLQSNPAGHGYASQRIERLMFRLRSVPLLRLLGRLAPRELRYKALGFVAKGIIDGPVGQRLAQTHRQRLEPMSTETRKSLLHELREPTLELQSFLGRPLPSWFE